MGNTLHISDFGGGVALLGSADVQRTDELQICDSYDIGERGQLIVASDISNFAASVFGIGGSAATKLYGIVAAGTAQDRYLLIVGEALNNLAINVLYVWRYNLPALTIATLVAGAPRAQGAIVTFASFPFVDRLGVQQRPTLMCIAPRETTQANDHGRTP